MPVPVSARRVVATLAVGAWLAPMTGGCSGPPEAQLPIRAELAALPVNGVPKGDTIAPDDAPYTARKLFDLDDGAIDESSGIGASRRYPGTIWTHNDSGDSARLFLIATEGDDAGKTLAEVQLEGATALDWEDMAVAGTGDSSWVYVGDIGDNLRKRAEVVIYRFREPNIQPGTTRQTLKVPCEKMTFRYPDGAHDAETLLATSEGDLILVTKLATGESGIYKTPQPFTPGASQELVKVGQFKFEATGVRSRLATGGDLSPDGKRLVIRTYTRAYEWALPSPLDWRASWSTMPRVWTLPESVQGEAICYGVNSKSLYLTSEQLPAPLFELVAGTAPENVR